MIERFSRQGASRLRFLQNSVSQPPGRDPILRPGINYTGPLYYTERIYRAAVSQSLRTTVIEDPLNQCNIGNINDDSNDNNTKLVFARIW
jgi:hypothetical protein